MSQKDSSTDIASQKLAAKLETLDPSSEEAAALLEMLTALNTPAKPEDPMLVNRPSFLRP